jgi:hypothetical protein
MTSWSWTANTTVLTEGLVFNAQKTAAGQPVGRGFDVGVVLLNRRGG